MDAATYPYTVRVTFTDRSRTPTGAYTTYYTDVDVLGTDDDDATLAANQIASAIRCDLHVMVLGHDILDGPI